jgi:hypothetical protein
VKQIQTIHKEVDLDSDSPVEETKQPVQQKPAALQKEKPQEKEVATAFDDQDDAAAR